MYRLDPLKWACVVLAVFTVSVVGCDDGLRTNETASIQIDPERFIITKLRPGERAEQSLTVKNVGSGVLRMINLRGEFGPEYNLYWTLGDEDPSQQRIAVENGVNRFPAAVDLQPEETLTFYLTYEARADQVPLGRVTFETNDSDNRNVAIPIQGAESGAELVVMPSVVDFGRVRPDEDAREVILVSNVGQTRLDIESVEINGSQDFSLEIGGVDPRVDPTVLSDPDGDGQQGVASNSGFEVTVIYTTELAGPDEGELLIRSNSIAPVTTVPIRANSEEPCIQVTPERIDFGAGLLGGLNPRPLTIQSCGMEPLRIDGLRLEATAEVFSIDEETFPQLPLRMPAADPALPASEFPARNLVVQFTPEEEIAYGGSLFIDSNDPYDPTLEIPLNGRGSQNECPNARVTTEEFFVAPLDVITLDGAPSTDPDGQNQRPILYEWTVLQRPMGSRAAPVESFSDELHPEDGGPEDDGSTPTAQFFVDIAGEYLLELTVTDRLGATAPSDSCPQPGARVRIVAEPLSDVHLQLLWSTPRDDNREDLNGADVDLHLSHPSGMGWFDNTYDCHYFNPTPDWGVLNQLADDPSLDIDDIDGGGPENINLNNPQDTTLLGGTYGVGVHYFRATQANFGGRDFGDSRATVRVYLGGELAYEGEEELRETNDFWVVGDIVWTADDRRFLTDNARVIRVAPFGD